MGDIPHCTGCGEYPGDLVADRIEELEAEVKRLREVLGRISRTSVGEYGCYYSNIVNIKRARAALKGDSHD